MSSDHSNLSGISINLSPLGSHACARSTPLQHMKQEKFAPTVTQNCEIPMKLQVQWRQIVQQPPSPDQ